MRLLLLSLFLTFSAYGGQQFFDRINSNTLFTKNIETTTLKAAGDITGTNATFTGTVAAEDLTGQHTIFLGDGTEGGTGADAFGITILNDSPSSPRLFYDDTTDLWSLQNDDGILREILAVGRNENTFTVISANTARFDDVTISQSLEVEPDANFLSKVITPTVEVTELLDVKAEAQITTLKVSGDATISGDLNADDLKSVGDLLTLHGDTLITGDLSLGADQTISATTGAFAKVVTPLLDVTNIGTATVTFPNDVLFEKAIEVIGLADLQTLTVASTVTLENNAILGDGTKKENCIYANSGVGTEGDTTTYPSVCYDADSSKWQFSNDGEFERDIGSGGGGGIFNILSNPDFEEGFSKDWVCARCSKAPINQIGETTLRFTPNGTASTLVNSLGTAIVPPRFETQLCELSIGYVGGGTGYSATATLRNGGVDTERTTFSLPLKSTFGYEKVNLIPCGKGDLRLTIAASAAATQVTDFDDFYFGPPRNVSLVSVREIEEKIPTIDDMTTNGEVTALRFTGLEIGEVYQMTGGLYVTSFQGYFSPSSTTILVNRDNLPTDYYRINRIAGQIKSIALSFYFKATSDTIYLHKTGGTLFGCQTTSLHACTKLQLSKTITQETYKNIPTVTEAVNTFTFLLSATGVVSEDFANAIPSGNCTRPAGGRYLCVFDSNKFSALPLCTAILIHNQDRNLDIFANLEESNEATRTVEFRSVLRTTGGLRAFGQTALVTCHRAPTDRKDVTVQPIIINQMVTGQDAPVAICRINQTTNLDTPVLIDPDSCVESLTRPATGDYRIVFAAGYFQSFPICVGSHANNIGDNIDVGRTGNDLFVTSRNLNGVKDSNPFNVICYGTKGE